MSSANSPAEDVKDILESSSAALSLTGGTNLFIATLPTSPDNCVSLYTYGGNPQEQYDHERPSVQVIIRNRSYQTGYALARDIKYALHDQYNNKSVNGTRYIRIHCISDILELGQDEKNRYKFSVNFMTERSGN